LLMKHNAKIRRCGQVVCNQCSPTRAMMSPEQVVTPSGKSETKESLQRVYSSCAISDKRSHEYYEEAKERIDNDATITVSESPDFHDLFWVEFASELK
ncbi:25651_t:CDS:2, partial [Dentiscutata erythropus]